LTLSPEGWRGDRVAFSNDPFTPAQSWVDAEGVEASLREIVKDRLLVILPTRSELESIGNMGSIIDNFPRVELITTTRALPPLGLAHMRPDRRESVKARRIVRGEKLAGAGFPTLDTVTPIIRILNTIWIHDRRSGILFTSDTFANELLPHRETPTVRRDSLGLPGAAEVRRSIIARFDWVERARTQALQQQWADLFGRITPTGIAPSLGLSALAPTARDLPTRRRFITTSFQQ
jgi:hypothetical protein